MRRYLLAIAGPAASAAAQFVQSFVLLHALSALQFGNFSFLLICSQLSWGVWSALFCAPMPVLLAAATDASRISLAQTLLTTNLLSSVAGMFCFLLLARSLGLPAESAWVFAAYGTLALLRWFARAYSYALGMAVRTVASDLTYAAVVLGGVGLVLRYSVPTLHSAFATLFVASALGLIPFGRVYFASQFLRIHLAAIRCYGQIWRHAGWSLLGVLTTELTANCHAYLVTLAFGADSFSPIAASALMIRPVTVAMNALSEFERATMAQQASAREARPVVRSVRLFRCVLLAGWVGTVGLVFILFRVAPDLVLPPRYDRGILVLGTALWLSVALVRLLRIPESTLLQAVGAFRPLAYASVISSIASVAMVIALLLANQPVWSIAGVFVGEVVFAWWTWRQARRWMTHHFVATGLLHDTHDVPSV